MKRLVRLTIILSLSIASVLLMGLGITIWVALQELPSIDALKNYQPPQSTIVLDRSNNVVGHFYDERRTVIPVKKLPNQVKFAFIAAEDADFFKHTGIDYFGLLRAMALEIKHWTVGGRRVGGSTITQQTARTMLLSSSQTYVRKLKEMVLAKRIEEALSKEEILHLYLNQIYFGNGAYGIEEAAQTYFAKPAEQLHLFEAAALASIPKSPNRINPLGDTERLKQRQHYVLDQMVKHGFIDKKTANEAKTAPLLSNVSDNSDRQIAPHFLQAVKTELLPQVDEEIIRRGGLKVYSTLDISMQKSAEVALRNGLLAIDKRYGYRGPVMRPDAEDNARLKGHLETFKKRAFVQDNKNKIWDLSRLNKATINAGLDAVINSIKLIKLRDGLVVGARVLSIQERNHSMSIDLGSRIAELKFVNMAWAETRAGKDKKAGHALKPGDIVLVKIESFGKQLSLSLEQEPMINGGLVALDVATGGILAMVGNYNFNRPFNVITQAKRQPGSGIKPLIYALAIDRELVTATSIITDAPKAFLDPGTNEFWRPRNHSRKYLGDITLRHCLRSSINTCTISLLEKIGLDGFLGFAKEVGLSTDATPYPRNLTIALGSAEGYPISIANAMRTIANRGIYSPYHMIDSVILEHGERKKLYTPTEKAVLKPESAFIVTNILQEVITGAQRSAHLPDVRSQLAGKTGTTNNARSVWFFGYSPTVLALVYVGYDDNRSIGANEWGITGAFPIWAKFMNSVASNHEEQRFLVPENIEWRYVDRDSGRIKEISNQEDVVDNGLMEAFIAGTAPNMALEDNLPHKTAPDLMDEAAFMP